MTHALLVGSPAIDAGDPAFASPPTNDQRGAPFVRVVDGDGGAARGSTSAPTSGRHWPHRTSSSIRWSMRTTANYSAGDLSLREAIEPGQRQHRRRNDHVCRVADQRRAGDDFADARRAGDSRLADDRGPRRRSLDDRRLGQRPDADGRTTATAAGCSTSTTATLRLIARFDQRLDAHGRRLSTRRRRRFSTAKNSSTVTDCTIIGNSAIVCGTVRRRHISNAGGNLTIQRQHDYRQTTDRGRRGHLQLRGT